ncbi:MAG: hypothetical protein AB1733_24045 [Thermodesulfobacteriota bacterium]
MSRSKLDDAGRITGTDSSPAPGSGHHFLSNLSAPGFTSQLHQYFFRVDQGFRIAGNLVSSHGEKGGYLLTISE